MSRTNPDRPDISTDDAERLSARHYDFHATAKPLVSYDDANFLLSGPGGESRILKISAASQDRSRLDAQNRGMQLVHDRLGTGRCPVLCRTSRGEETTLITGRGERTHVVRMLTYVPGTFVSEGPPPGTEFLESLGGFMGRVTAALDRHSHPSLETGDVWNLVNFAKVEPVISKIPSPRDRTLVEHYFRTFQTLAPPLLKECRIGTIHGDANDNNVLLSSSDGRVGGIIDFGDMCTSYLVAEAAVTAAYGTFRQRDPLAAITAVLSGFHRVVPLDDAEINAFFHLTYARLCTTIAVSCAAFAQEPDNRYLIVSVDPALEVLRTFFSTSPKDAYRGLRRSLGLCTAGL